MAPWWLVSKVVSVAHVASKGSVDAWGLVPEGQGTTAAVLIWMDCAATRAVVVSGPKLLQRAMSGSRSYCNWGLW